MFAIRISANSGRDIDTAAVFTLFIKHFLVDTGGQCLVDSLGWPERSHLEQPAVKFDKQFAGNL